MNIHIANVSFHTTAEMLIELFSQHGEVTAARILSNEQSGKTRRFGFVEMRCRDAAYTAIRLLDGKEIQGRPLRVSPAR